MNIWIITDTHFNHDKMVEYCGRPEDFNVRIWKGLDVIREDDLLIHLGDVCIGKDAEVHERLSKLRCKKVLTRGNHDGKSYGWYLSHGWDSVCESITLEFGGNKVIFSHLPLRESSEWDLNIHGHFHNNLHRLLDGIYVVDGEEERNKINLSNLTPKHILLSLEEEGYMPKLLTKLLIESEKEEER
ncbi:MAG: metallophosphoesterase [Proteobacteria bacterium]|jgi:calcineurin-like phosphoesterase family protein|nr:metallophosphoesterase [Pseudomonadota bacterium]